MHATKYERKKFISALAAPFWKSISVFVIPLLLCSPLLNIALYEILFIKRIHGGVCGQTRLTLTSHSASCCQRPADRDLTPGDWLRKQNFANRPLGGRWRSVGAAAAEAAGRPAVHC